MGVVDGDGDADTVELALGDADTVLEKLTDGEADVDGLGVIELVGETLLVALAVGVTDGGTYDAEADGDGVMVAAAVELGEMDGVGDVLGMAAVSAYS